MQLKGDLVMNQNWTKYEEAAKKGPFAIFLKVFFFIIGITVIISVVGGALGWFSEAAQVAREEFGPRAGLEKYEWFLEQASAIEKMDQDIVLFEDRKKSVEEKYGKYGDSTKWPPHISVQYNQEIEAANTDLLAVVSQRNNLVKEYNAASEKFNWAPFETELNKPREIFQEYK